MKRIINTVLFILLASNLMAVPAYAGYITRTMPNGEVIEYRMVGDEYAHYYQLRDGRTFRFTATGYVIDENEPSAALQRRMQLCNEENSPISKNSGLLATQSTQATFPLKGEIRSVVILAEFSDLAFTVSEPRKAFSRLLNEQNYRENNSTGSARDYFLASSMGVFRPYFDVYGPYRLEHDYAYYGAHEGKRSDKNAADMIVQACRLAEQDGVDFSKYDEDNDGVIDNVFVYYAGHNEAEHGGENTIWPHKSQISSRPKLSGKSLYTYSCTSELSGSSGNMMCGIGTFCHEFGHVLGLPDLYNTTNNEGDNDIYTVGSWDVMCQGPYNNEGHTPPLYSAFERFMLGWLTPVQLTTDSTYILKDLETTNTAYLIAKEKHNLEPFTPSPYEYFMIENRQRVGWDSVAGRRTTDCAIPGEGMLLSHIVFSAAYWNSNTFNDHDILGYDIVEALDQTTTTAGPTDTYPGSAGITFAVPTLSTAERLTDKQIYNIAQSENGDILFSFGSNKGGGFVFSRESIENLITTYDVGPKEYTIDSVILTGKNIDTKEIQISIYSGNFSFSPDSGATWYDYNSVFSDTCLSDSSYHRMLLVRHEPKRQNCSTTNGSLQVRSKGAQSRVLTLKGSAPRPIYIHQPKITEVRDITPYSFTFSWEDIEDAEQYYLTIYSKTSGETEMLQSFEDFFDTQAVARQGWEADYSIISSQESADGKGSVVFNVTGQYIKSEQYSEPVSRLAFWFTNHYTSTDEVGQLRLTAFNSEGEAIVIDNITIRSTSRYVTKNYEFAENDGYRQFMLEYTAQTAVGNVFIDKWQAFYDYQLTYVYKNEEREVVAPLHTAIVNSLSPNTTYNIIVQAAEAKGCSPHKTILANPYSVKTMPGTEGKNQLSIIPQDDGSVIVYLPDIGDANNKLFIFTANGVLVETIDIQAGSNNVVVPAAVFAEHQLYFCKYSNYKKIRRKDYWGKIIN